MRPIVVTDGDERAALAIVRSLGRRGERVVVCSPGGRSLAGASRYAEAEERVGTPNEEDAYVRSVAEVAHRWNAELLLPVTEASLRSLLPRHARLAPASIPFPDEKTFCRASDKHVLTQIARRLGLAVPDQAVVPATSRLSGRLPEGHEVVFPLVVKPSRSFVRTSRGTGKVSVTHVRDRRELRRAIRSYPVEAFPLLVQRRVVGPGVGIFLLVWGGEARAVSAHRRIREKPPSGGVSVCRESVQPDPSLVAMGLRLLRQLGWQGVAMVEFKLDAETGTPYLMEVNGRFWGSLQLAVDAGVDFPALLVEAARGRAPASLVTGNGYVRSRWLWGEVDHLVASIRSPEGNGKAPSRWRHLRTAAEVLRWRRGDRTEVLRWSDGRPFLRESSTWLRNVAKRAP